MEKLKQLIVNHLQFIAKRVPFDYEKHWNNLYDKYGFTKQYCSENTEEERKDNRNIFNNTIQTLGLNKEAKILDIGCGVGIHADYLLNNGFQNYMGIDLNKDVIKHLCNKFNGFKFKQQDIIKEQIKGDYDLILMLNITQHITKDKDFEFIMNNIKQSLNNNTTKRFLVLN